MRGRRLSEAGIACDWGAAVVLRAGREWRVNLPGFGELLSPFQEKERPGGLVSEFVSL